MRNKLLLGAATALLAVGIYAAPSMADDKKPAHPSAATMQQMLKDRCAERSARIAGGVAYLEARLKPTAAQLPAWNKWRDITLTNARNAEQACTERPVPAKDSFPTIVERRAFMLKMLSMRVDALKASQPALEALYQSLDAGQKEILDRHGEIDMREPFARGPRPEHRPMLKDRQRMMDDDGPDGPEGPDAPPPAE